MFQEPSGQRLIAIHFSVVLSIVATAVPLCLASGAASVLTPSQRSGIQQSYRALPVFFEPNQGQTDPHVKFFSRRHGYNLFLTSSEVVVAYGGNLQGATARVAQKSPSTGSPTRSTAALRMKLVGASAEPEVVADGELPGKSNYYLGNDPSKWRSNVPHFSRVSYREVYPGVDLVFHDSRQELEFDFVVAPHATTGKIALHFDGTRRMRVDEAGDLVLTTEVGEIHLHKPVAYQEETGVRHPVDAQFAIHRHGQVAFKIGVYNSTEPLVIDPSLVFSTYLGGSGEDEAEALAASGYIYVTGKTNSINFPTGAINGYGVFQGALNGGFDAFVTALFEDGSGVVFSTYLGGSQDDEGTAIAVVPNGGSVWVAGVTSSTDFPITAHAFQSSFGGGGRDAFVVELCGTSLSYSTYLGGSGSDSATAITADNGGNVYVVGGTFSTDFPTLYPLQSANKGGEDGFLTVIGNPSFSTYLGGSQNDRITAIALGDGIMVTGATASPDFPITANAFQAKCGSDGNCNGGLDDAFVAEINVDTNGDTPIVTLPYSTFLGGSDADEGLGILVDATNKYWVVGQTLSPDFPVTTGAFQTKCGTNGACNGGKHDVFLTSINPPMQVNGPSSLNYSTYFGGSGDDVGTGIAQDSFYNIYLTGRTDSTDFPTGPALHPPFQPANAGGTDAFITVFKLIGTPGAPLLYSSYLGGSGNENSLGGSSANPAIGAIAFDFIQPNFNEPPPPVNIYVAGGTTSTDFPVLNPLPGQQTYQGGPSDAFVTEISDVLPLNSVAISVTSNILCNVNNGPGQPPFFSNCQFGITSLQPPIWRFSPVSDNNGEYTNLYYPATPVTLSGQFPVFWGGACSGYALTCNVTVNGPLNVSAVYGLFSLSDNPSSTTVNAGQSFSSTITVSALSGSGYSGAVSLSCTLYEWPNQQNPMYPDGENPPPAYAPSCPVSPAIVNLVNGGSATATMTLYTTAPPSALGLPGWRKELRWAYGIWVPTTGFLLTGLVISTDRKRKKLLAILASFLFASLVLLAACGGSAGGSGGGGVGGTPAGGYGLVIQGSASDGNFNATTFGVTVQ